jgi:hypothetical protein
MFRPAALLLLLSLTVSARAQDDEPARLKLSSAAEATPRLKYRLLPDRRDLKPGNAAALYYRTLAMFSENRVLLSTDFGAQHWQDWIEMPLKDLPLKMVREKVGYYRNFYKELVQAAHRADTNWQIEDRPEGLGLLLPDIQAFRGFAVILAVKARLEMLEGRFDDAIQTLQTGYALGYHLGKAPTVIHLLVGAAITNVMNTRLEELIQQPGAPNLYWALATLPRPFFDLRRPLQQEVRMLENMSPWLKKLEGGPVTEAQVRASEREIEKSLGNFGLRRRTYGEELLRAVTMSATYPEARAFLLARKAPADEVDSMPVFQAVALYCYRDLREAGEEAQAWMDLPGGLRHPGFQKVAERWRKAFGRLDQLFFRGLLRDVSGPGYDLDTMLLRLERVLRRTERRFAALRTIEAVRLYAASHGGKLPAELADIKEVPVPNDPATRKPWLYSVDGDAATLRTPRMVGIKDTPVEIPHYELTIKK